MNISVYFYDEEGKYTHMDMAPLEFDSEGKQILPENSTAIFPPDLSTDPRFSVELQEWIPQKEVTPIDSGQMLSEMEALKQYVESTLAMQRKSITRLDEDLFRTKYHLQICLPNAAHYFK